MVSPKINFLEHLGLGFWVETECRDPVMNHSLKMFERKNNFPIPTELSNLTPFFRWIQNTRLRGSGSHKFLGKSIGAVY